MHGSVYSIRFFVSNYDAPRSTVKPLLWSLSHLSTAAQISIIFFFYNRHEILDCSSKLKVTGYTAKRPSIVPHNLTYAGFVHISYVRLSLIR